MTRFARNRGYSDIKQMNRDNGKSKNFAVRLGTTFDTGALRSASGKRPYAPKGDKSHWLDTDYERRIRKEFGRPQLTQKD